MHENPWRVYRLRKGESLTVRLMKEEEKRRNGKNRELLKDIFPIIASVGIAISQLFGQVLSEKKEKNTNAIIEKTKIEWGTATMQIEGPIEEKKPFTHCEPQTENSCRPGQATIGGLEGNKCCQ